jgi:hypothetical protein
MEPASPARANVLPGWQRPDRWLFALLERVETRHGALASAMAVAVIAEGISVLFASTMVDDFRGRFTGLSSNPFAHGAVDIPFPEHRLRILGPVFAWALGLHGDAGAYLPIAFNVPLLALLYFVVKRETTALLAVVFTLLMATTHLTMTTRTLIGYHDTMVFLCAVLAMVSRSNLLSGVCFLLGLFGDPRIALMIPMVFVWMLTRPDLERPMASAFMRTAILVGMMLVFLGLSSVLIDVFEYRTQSDQAINRYLNGEFLREMKPSFLHLTAFLTFKAGWLLAFLAVWLLLARRPLLALLLAGNMLAIFCSGLLVYDFSRALTFCFPVLVFGVIELHRSAPRIALPVLGTCYLINLITPFYQGMTYDLWIQSYPLPVDVARWLVRS